MKGGLVVFALVGWLGAQPALAQLRLPHVLSDHAVLQPDSLGLSWTLAGNRPSRLSCQIVVRPSE